MATTPGAPRYRFPHSVSAVLQQLRLSLGLEQQTQLGDTVALLDDRDRWVEDHLSALYGEGGGAGGGRLPTGALIDWAGTVAPEGFMVCDGSVLARDEFPDLFAVLGTSWNIGGEAATTFRIPDFRGRAPIGAGTGSGLTARAVGQYGGAETVTLTEAQMPSHTHSYNAGQSSAVLGVTAGGDWPFFTANTATLTSGAKGGGAAHPNMQPFAVVLKCIKT